MPKSREVIRADFLRHRIFHLTTQSQHLLCTNPLLWHDRVFSRLFFHIARLKIAKSDHLLLQWAMQNDPRVEFDHEN
jgi:hypothetical protein